MLTNATLALKGCLHLHADHKEILDTLFLVLGSFSFSLYTKQSLKYSNAVCLELLQQLPTTVPVVKFNSV